MAESDRCFNRRSSGSHPHGAGWCAPSGVRNRSFVRDMTQLQAAHNKMPPAASRPDRTRRTSTAWSRTSVPSRRLGTAADGSQCVRVNGSEPAHVQTRSGAVGHARGDIARLTVEVLACAVVAHGRSRVRVTGGNPPTANVDAGFGWVHPPGPDAGRSRELTQPSGGCVTAHSDTASVRQHRPGR